MRRSFKILFLLLCLGVCARAQQPATDTDQLVDTLLEEQEMFFISPEDIFGDTVFYGEEMEWYDDEPTEQLHDAQELINYGVRYLRVRYRYGGTTPAGFDCSGFTQYVFRHFGIRLQRSSRDQYTQFPRIKRSNIQPGDLVFFSGHGGGGEVGHVGIVSDVYPDGTFRFLHASCSLGITFSHSYETYYANRLRGFNRPCTSFSGNYGESEMDNANPF